MKTTQLLNHVIAFPDTVDEMETLLVMMELAEDENTPRFICDCSVVPYNDVPVCWMFDNESRWRGNGRPLKCSNGGRIGLRISKSKSKKSKWSEIVALAKDRANQHPSNSIYQSVDQ